jgi:acetaldehyde dehydrogenase (acetylating)
MKIMKVAILGSGNIGTDLLIKVLRSPHLECCLFIGRRLGTTGMTKAASLGVSVSDQSIAAIERDPDCCDLVFDATTAKSHARHSKTLKELGKIAIDLTPAKVGKMVCPAVNLVECLNFDNVNTITCGGQTSIPLAKVISEVHDEIDYIEVVSTIASRSAGPGTRVNIDEYIQTTEAGLIAFSACKKAKVILNLNPAEPPLIMQTTVFAKVESPRIEQLRVAVNRMVERTKAYAPGYQLITEPIFEDGRIVIMVQVQGRGDYLQEFAGNLDIINSAAIATAEAFAMRKAKSTGDDRRNKEA